MKRFFISILVISFIFASIQPCYASTLSLSEVQSRAITYSKDLDSGKIDITKKKNKLKEARKYVSAERKKAWWLFTKKYIYPKIYTLATKVDEASHKLFMANKEIDFILYNTRYEAESLYSIAVVAKVAVDRQRELLRKARIRLARAEQELEKDLIEASVVEEEKDKVAAAEDKYNLLIETHEESLAEISSLIYKDISKGYNLKMDFVYLEPQHISLNILIMEALNNNEMIYKVNKEIEYLTGKINKIKRVYNDEFSSSIMSGLNNITANGYEGISSVKIVSTYDNFVKRLIARWGEDWKSYYGIDLFFFEIKIPKLFRFGEFDGLRFLDDGSYALLSEILELIKNVNLRTKLEKATSKLVSAKYKKLSTKAEAYKQAKLDFILLNQEYELNQQLFKSGKVEADVLIENKAKIVDQDSSIFDLLVDISGLLREIDYQTGGFLQPYLRGEKPISDMSKDAPFMPKDASMDDIKKAAAKAGAAKYTWTTKVVVKEVSAEFKVVTEEKEYEKYGLFTLDGKPIGRIVEIKKPIIHLVIVLEDRDSYMVKFYKEDKVKAVGKILGYGEKGEIEVTTIGD